MLSKLYEEKLRRDIFILSILALITVFAWIGIATYQALSKSKIKPRVKKQIKPLTAELSVDTMENIRSRQQIVEVNWKNLKPALREVVVIPKPEASSSGQIASTSGELFSPEASKSAD